MPIKKTPLYEAHIAAGAKMINFANYSLPINYGSQIKEHQAVRCDAGMFDVSHMVIIDITGLNAKRFMSILIANDVNKLKPYQALYSCMLNENAGVIDDLIIYYLADDSYRLVVNATTRDKDISWIKKQATNFDIAVNIRDDLAMIAIQGPNAIDKFNNAMPGLSDKLAKLKPLYTIVIGSLFIARTGYTGEDGIEIMLPIKSAKWTWDMLVNAGVKPCGLGARDSLRLEAGMSLYGNEMDDSISPIDAGLSWSIDLKDSNRGFIGRDKLSAKKYDFVGIILLDKGIIRSKAIINTNNGDGYITSGGFSPTIGASIALARVPINASGKCKVKVRNKLLNAKIVKPRFVRNGKQL